MKRRIKALYIITIIAILSFLGMQIFWLYGRYELYLDEYEKLLGTRIIESIDSYNQLRFSKADSVKHWNAEGRILPYFHSSISRKYDKVAETDRKIIVYTYRRPLRDLIGITSGQPITGELVQEIIEKKNELIGEIADSTIYDASQAADETEAWLSFKNLTFEQDCPFTKEGIDSVLRKSGIKGTVSLAKADSMAWQTKVNYHTSPFRPRVSVLMPYSQLEGKTVEIECRVSPFDVLPDMWQTLIIAVLVSVLLIVCLGLQFSTVLKLSKLDKMRNSFITTMIHELKRPISTLKMCVSGIENPKMMENPVTRSELMVETRSALNNLSAYFSKLRDITFNNVEQIPLNIQTVDLRELFDSVVGAVAVPGGKKVEFVNDIATTVSVSADRSHLFNILTNLVENAVKYSSESVTIQASASVDDNGAVEIRVTDTGFGIAETDLRHIFNRFYRGRQFASGLPGIGLGLAYVKLLVDAHGGAVKVESQVGQGASFSIILPQ